jgi:outer membrane protein TolC
MVGKSQQKIFTEKEFIATIKKFHPVAKQAAIEVEIAEAEITTSRGVFDPVFSMENNQKEFDGLTYYNHRNVEIKIPTWYGIDLSAGKENITGSRLNPEETKGTLSYLSLSVPLMQNLIIDKRRATLQQAKIFKDLSKVERSIVLNELVREALGNYWHWWKQYAEYTLMQAVISNANKRFQMIKTTHMLGERAAIDTLEAFTQIQSLQLRQNEIFTALLNSQLQVSAFLWADNNVQYDLPADVKPQELKAEDELMLEYVVMFALTHPELKQYTFKLKALQIERRLHFQQFLPAVNLKYNQLGTSLSKTINSAWFNNNYRFGLSVSMPLRFSEGRGEFRKAKLKMDYTTLAQLNKQVQVINKVKQYYTEWQQSTTQITLQNEIIKNTLTLLRGEETRFFSGESSLFMINAREMRAIEAQQKLIELKAKNQKTLIELKGAAGMFSK